MTRYFYTDPLAAAWMAKRFGMRFDVDMEDVLLAVYHFHRQQTQHLDISPELQNISVTVTGRKIFVHPGSLHLLEPKVGDLLEVLENGFNVAKRVHDAFDLKALKSEWRLLEIIHRAGTRFHWPESEAA
jgi:hypothetical protein